MNGSFGMADFALALIMAIAALLAVAIVAVGLRRAVHLAIGLIGLLLPDTARILRADFDDLSTDKDDLRQCGWALLFMLQLPHRVRHVRQAERRPETRTSGGGAKGIAGANVAPRFDPVPLNALDPQVLRAVEAYMQQNTAKYSPREVQALRAVEQLVSQLRHGLFPATPAYRRDAEQAIEVTLRAITRIRDEHFGPHRS